MKSTSQSSFFSTGDQEWFVGTDAARGPWQADACHAGPVTGLLARALEGLLSDKRLTRLTAVFMRPIPMTGFRIEANVSKSGRTLSVATADLQDEQGRTCATASSIHLATSDLGQMPTTETAGPRLEEAAPDKFPVSEINHDLPTFADAVDVAYPPGESSDPGPTTIWMRTPPLLPDEVPSPFQRLCPLADCANGLSRNAELTEVTFMNPDITIASHRDPASDWLAATATSFWERNSAGLASAMLFDESGSVGLVLQPLVLSRVQPQATR